MKPTQKKRSTKLTSVLLAKDSLISFRVQFRLSLTTFCFLSIIVYLKTVIFITFTSRYISLTKILSGTILQRRTNPVSFATRKGKLDMKALCADPAVHAVAALWFPGVRGTRRAFSGTIHAVQISLNI